MSYKRIVACTMKNEGPYILEWIAYHQMIGFDGFVICSNDCTDGTNLILNRLDALGHIVHIDNPQGPNMDPQRSAYHKIKRNDAFKAAEWVLVSDADEFLNIKIGDHSIDALLATMPTADAISINWKLMGSNGEKYFDPNQLVTERYTKGSTNDDPENGLVWGFKTLFRPNKFDYMGVHRPRFRVGDDRPLPKTGDINWFNGSGEDLGDRFYEKGWRSNKHCYGYALAQVNHYATKSRQDFLLKRLRGTANAKDKDRISMKYWNKYNINNTEDASITTGELRPRIDALLEDSDLAALHRATVDSCRRTIAREMDSGDVKSFIEQLDDIEKGEEAA
ncbi:MAG: glycosyltransferase family 2 protein [Pseudomonadota bacterium]